jgi:BirA family biotin operon repressor/biotin-[acetyl-CoA-carboxylase] ligase
MTQSPESSELSEKTAMPPIFLYDEVASTNDLALAAAPEQALHGACWAADRQTKGRGRREIGGGRREWFSPENANLYMSVILRPDIEPARASGLTLAAAAGVCGLLRDKCGVDLWIKWPNDLLIGSKKVCGILSEAVSVPGGVESVVVGLGINVNLPAERVPAELADVMTSLRIESGTSFDRLELLRAVRDRVVEYGDRYAEKGYPAIIDELREHDHTEGRAVSVSRNGGWVAAVSRGISDDGGLLVEVDGQVEKVQAGEVKFAPQEP